MSSSAGTSTANDDNINEMVKSSAKPLQSSGPIEAATTATTTSSNMKESENAPLPSKQKKNHSNNVPRPRRPICSKCQRPTPKACICEGLPETPISLQRCHVLVLQHPHEGRRKNRSLPLLELTLSPDSITTVISRRFGDQNPKAVQLLQNSSRVLLIFPEQEFTSNNNNDEQQERPPPVLSLSQAVEYCQENNTQENDDDQKVLIVVLDATWKYAKEMDRANREAQQYPKHIQRVSLSWDDQARPKQADKAFRFGDVRTPPAFNSQYLSTAECVAWVLSAIEPAPQPQQPQQYDNNNNNDFYTTLMKPLDVMVEKWNECRRDSHEKDGDDRNNNHRKKKRNLPSNDDEDGDGGGDGDGDDNKYSYYGNAQVQAEEQQEAMGLASRASFFTNGDQESSNSTGTKKKKKKRARR